MLCVGFCDPLAAWPPVHPRSAAREGVRLAPLALYGDATGRTLGGAGVQAACTLEGCGHSQKVADRIFFELPLKRLEFRISGVKAQGQRVHLIANR